MWQWLFMCGVSFHVIGGVLHWATCQLTWPNSHKFHMDDCVIGAEESCVHFIITHKKKVTAVVPGIMVITAQACPALCDAHYILGHLLALLRSWTPNYLIRIVIGSSGLCKWHRGRDWKSMLIETILSSGTVKQLLCKLCTVFLMYKRVPVPWADRLLPDWLTSVMIIFQGWIILWHMPLNVYLSGMEIHYCN